MFSISRYLISLGLTLAIEGAVAYFLFGRRDKEFYRVFLYVNLVTHPILHAILNALIYFAPAVDQFWALFTLEIGIVVAEWRLYRYALGPGIFRIGCFSLTANAVSYLTGLVIVCQCLLCSLRFCQPVFKLFDWIIRLTV